MALSAALPVNWSPVLIYFGITIILGLLDWPGPRARRALQAARAARGGLCLRRSADGCLASSASSAATCLPSFTSHLIRLAHIVDPEHDPRRNRTVLPRLGLRPPVTSWGVLLNEAQNINVVALYPWLMLPVVPVFIVVLAFNFFGDGPCATPPILTNKY